MFLHFLNDNVLFLKDLNNPSFFKRKEKFVKFFILDKTSYEKKENSFLKKINKDSILKKIEYKNFIFFFFKDFFEFKKIPYSKFKEVLSLGEEYIFVKSTPSFNISKKEKEEKEKTLIYIHKLDSSLNFLVDSGDFLSIKNIETLDFDKDKILYYNVENNNFYSEKIDDFIYLNKNLNYFNENILNELNFLQNEKEKKDSEELLKKFFSLNLFKENEEDLNFEFFIQGKKDRKKEKILLNHYIFYLNPGTGLIANSFLIYSN